MDIKNRIEIAKQNLRKAENAKVAAETQKANAVQQLQEVEEQMKSIGVTPETISEEINKLEYQIKEDLSKVEQLIPRDI